MMADTIPESAKQDEETVDSIDFSWITVICGIATACIGILGISGSFLPLPVFSGVIYGYKPMSFSAALVWIFFGLVLAGIARKSPGGVSRTIIGGLLSFIIFIQLINFPMNIAGNHFIVERLSVEFSSAVLGVPTTLLSPVTSGLILVSGLGLLFLIFAPGLVMKYSRTRDIPGNIGILVSFVSFIFIIGYLYGTPFFYGTRIIPITLPSACALLIFGFGLATAAGPSAAPLKYFTGSSTHAQLLRAFIPLTIAIILLDELLHVIIASYEYVHNALTLALIISVFTLVTVAVVGRAARLVSGAIDFAELQRRETETELRAAYEQLAGQEEELHQQYDDLSMSQQSLLERERQYRTILRTAMDGFCLVDLKGGFLDVNDAFCAMFGYTREEMLRLSLRDIEVKETADVIAIHMDEIIHNGSDRFETRYRCKDGRIIDAEVSAVYTGPEKPRFVTFHRDITERNRAQKALDLAKKKLTVLNMVTLTDLKNAIFSLEGFTQLIKTSSLEGTVKKYIERQEEILKRISRTLDIAHSYQDMGVKPAQWQNVNQVFLIAISHLDFSTIQHHLDLDDLEIFADPLLEQAFQILAGNTLTHGGIATRVSLTYREDTDSLRILYEDNGHGIPDSMKTEIFTHDYMKKMGKGLFLVREILEITGMSICESGIPGAGARFEITVPKEGYRFSEK